MKTILFVNDDPSVQTIYRKCLQNEGFKVESALDGPAARKILSKKKPDMVLLDVISPELDGSRVLEYIRRDNDLKKTPVIIISNSHMPETGEDAILTSANKRLLKAACTPSTLLESVQTLLTASDTEEITPAVGATSVNARSSANERSAFMRKALVENEGILELARAYAKSPATTTGLTDLHQRVQSLKAAAETAGCSRVAILLNSFEALIAEIINKPSWSSPSLLQTIAQTVDCLNLLLKNDDPAADASGLAKAKVLVVDDDPVCSHVTVTCLKRAKLATVSVMSPQAGLKMLQEDRFDLILLDINMPGMDGFEVCEQLRKLPGYQKTPVLFITAFSNYQNRTKSVLSGGNDFIAKPVSALELGLNAITHLFKSGAQRAEAEQPDSATSATAAAEATTPATASAPVNQARNSEVENETPSAAPLPPASLNGHAKKTTASSSPVPLTPPRADIQPKPTSPAKFMKKTDNNQTFENVFLQVSSIVYGEENVTDINHRLLRMALERDNINTFDDIVQEVARLIFGEANMTELNVRLVRMALERYNLDEVAKAA